MAIVVNSGKGRRKTGMLVVTQAVGAREGGALSITLRNERTGKWLDIEFDAADAKVLRKLIGVADEHGPSKAAEALNKAFGETLSAVRAAASKHLGKL